MTGIDLEELLDVINEHRDIDTVEPYISEGRVVEERPFAVPDWVRYEAKDLGIRVHVLNLVHLPEASQRRQTGNCSFQRPICQEAAKLRPQQLAYQPSVADRGGN